MYTNYFFQINHEPRGQALAKSGSLVYIYIYIYIYKWGSHIRVGGSRASTNALKKFISNENDESCPCILVI
jgi:hypothetical protein